MQRPSGNSHVGFSQDARVLVERCLAGDDGAWRWLADRYWPVGHRVAERVLGRVHASYAPDVAQEGFVVLLAKLPTWRSTSHASLAAWIARLARRRALNLRRTLLRRWCRERPLAMSPRHGSRELHDPAWEWAQAAEVLKFHLNRRQARVVDALLGGSTQLEIALFLGVSVSTVGRDVAAIRTKFREIRETTDFFDL